MRTTVRIRDDLLQRAKKRAVDEGRTLTSLIEEALMLVVAQPKISGRQRVKLPVSQATGGCLPGIDLSRSSDLEDVLNTP